MTSKPFVYGIALVVLLICVHAFFLGSGLTKGKFENEPIAWYFLAKGIFCALSLILTQELLTAIRGRHRDSDEDA